MNGAYHATTKGIHIQVQPVFLPEQSDPNRHLYVWAYHITVTNRSDIVWKLASRHWEITDANGHQQIVDGEGVVGEQPLIQPGTSFEYASGVPLKTACGMMTGYYIMLSKEGEQLRAQIPLFSLDSPFEKRQLN